MPAITGELVLGASDERAGRPLDHADHDWGRRCVALLAAIAATVSYLHMHLLGELHGQPGWVGALTPLSVDGMIVTASTTLLTDSGNTGAVH